MSFKKLFNIFITILLLVSCSKKPEIKRFSQWDYKYMKTVKKLLKKGSSSQSAAYLKLLADAESAHLRAPYSVTNNKIVYPGGTKNDYLSMGSYWWPDPAKADGLPYIRRDGDVNPESSADYKQLMGMVNDVRTLSLAWFFTGNKDFATKAVELLQVWFVDEETRMNPNLEFGQAIPGRTPGRATGIIETRSFSTLLDAIILLESSGKLHRHDRNVLEEWFAEYFNWLITSDPGRDVNVYPNHHATAYDLQVLSIARYLEDKEYLMQKLAEVPSDRIDKMIDGNGRQPEEIVRDDAFSYSVSNLANFFEIGEIGLKSGTDIFSYTNPNGGSIQKALEFVSGYIGREADWPFEQSDEWMEAESNIGLLLRRAARYYQNVEYKIMWEEAFKARAGDHWSVLVVQGI